MLLLRLLKLIPLMILTMCTKVAEGVTCSSSGCTFQSLGCTDAGGTTTFSQYNYYMDCSSKTISGPVHITNLILSTSLDMYFHNNEITSFPQNK